MWSGKGRVEVDTTGIGGVEEGDARSCVRAGGNILGEYCSMSARNKVEAGERSVAGQITGSDLVLILH